MATTRVTIDHSYIDELAQKTEQGLKEAIRREVERRQKLGLPIVVQRNGQIIDLQTGKPCPPSGPGSEPSAAAPTARAHPSHVSGV